MKNNNRPPACMPFVRGVIKKHNKEFIGYGLIIAIMMILQNVVILELLRFISDELVKGESRAALMHVVFFLCVYLTVALLKKVGNLLEIYFKGNVSMEVERGVIYKYSKIRYRDYYFDAATVLGKVRGTGIGAVENWCSFFIDVTWKGISLVVSAIYLSSINWVALFLCVIITIAFMISSYKDNLKLPPLLEQFNGYMTQLYKKQWEQIKNHKIATFLNLDRVVAPYKEMVDQFMVDLKKVKVIYNRSTLFASFGTDIIILVAALFCAMMPLGEKLELGKILALLLSIPNVSNMIFSIPALRNSWQQSMEGMKTLDDIFQMADKQKEIKILERENIDCVRVKNMSFWYQKQEKRVFENLNIEMSKGIHLIKGNSGCGKSTFMRILAGELPILSGTLELGEKTINANTREDFNSYIEYMPQIPIVINKTLCENIVMGQEVNKQRLGQAIYYAGLKDMVEKLPQGVETVVSSEKLSSGEKQKIALARVFYQDKPVWVLDEPTSALDPVSIKKILKSIEECAENKIVILSSHQSIEENNKMKVYSWENTGNRRGE